MNILRIIFYVTSALGANYPQMGHNIKLAAHHAGCIVKTGKKCPAAVGGPRIIVIPVPIGPDAGEDPSLSPDLPENKI